MEWNIFCIIYLIAVGVNSQIQFQPDTTQHCNGEPVEYQCTIDTDVLTWRVLLNNGTQFGTDAIYILNTNAEPSTIGDVFIPERLSAVMMSPLVTNISFTAQSSINDYTILCEDSISLNNINVTITVITPNSPGSVLVDTNSFSNSSVNISWTESPSVCNTIFTYNVNSTNDVSTGTSTSTVLEGLVPSDDNYCVTVTATDYTTRTSEQSCFRFNVPEPPMVDEPILTDVLDDTYDVTVEWEPTEFVVDTDVTVPILTGYRVTLKNTTDDDSVTIATVPVLLSPDIIQYNFTNVPQGRLYTVTVIAVNVVKEIGSSPTTRTIIVPGEITIMSTTTSTSPSTTTSVSSSTSTNTPSSDTSSSTTTTTTTTTTPTVGDLSSGLPPYIPAVIVVGCIIIIALLIVIALIIGLICYKKRSNNKSDLNDLFNPKEDKNAPIPLVVQKNIPETGQSLYEDPNSIEHVQAPTGDVYALPDKNSKRRPPPTQPVAEIPTYQDPNTIKREQAPTGDIYTLPEKKPVYSKVNKNKQDEGTMYAELELSNTPKSPSEVPLLDHQVMYSDVRR